MKRIFLLLVILGVFSGCASVRAPVPGLIFTDIKSPEAATANAVGMKSGKACASSILGIIATGDASVGAAAKDGNIKKISHVDSKGKSILGFWAEYCTIVYGR